METCSSRMTCHNSILPWFAVIHAGAHSVGRVHAATLTHEDTRYCLQAHERRRHDDYTITQHVIPPLEARGGMPHAVELPHARCDVCMVAVTRTHAANRTPSAVTAPLPTAWAHTRNAAESLGGSRRHAERVPLGSCTRSPGYQCDHATAGKQLGGVVQRPGERVGLRAAPLHCRPRALNGLCPGWPLPQRAAPLIGPP